MSGSAGRCLKHNTSKFVSGDEGEERFYLVLALNLENVEEVGAGGLNSDYIVIFGGREVGEGFDNQLVG
jgi:hypothetical protein